MTAATYLPILFLPGMLCDERLWSEQIKVISLQTRTQFIDLRIHNSLKTMVNAIDEVPFEKFILCGFSMGGYVAQEYTILHPSRVFHLILVSVSREGLSPSEIQSRLCLVNYFKLIEFTLLTCRTYK